MVCFGLKQGGFGFILALAALFAAAGSSPCLCRAGQEVRVVEVEGVAPVIDNDLIQARDEALADARVRAIEQVAGVKVEARAVYGRELMLADEFDITAGGVLQDERILSQGLGPDGLYRVGLKASVSPDGLGDRLKRMLREDAVVLALREDNLGTATGVNLFENRLRAELSRAGYQRITAQEPGQDEIRDGPDRDWVETVGFKHLADVVIAGRISSSPSGQHAPGLCSAHANGWLRVFLVREGRTLAAAVAQSVRGFGPDMEQAGQAALSNAAKALCADVLRRVAPRRTRQVRVVVSGIPDFHSFKKYKGLIAAMRWVHSVEEQSYNPARTVFTLGYAESPGLLASRLGRFRDFQVQGYDPDEIRIKVKPPD